MKVVSGMSELDTSFLSFMPNRYLVVPIPEPTDVKLPKNSQSYQPRGCPGLALGQLPRNTY